MISSQQKQEISDFAAASIFLSCKLCDEHRRIRDVLNIQHVLQMNESSSVQLVSLDDWSTISPPALDERYWKRKDEMVKAEQTLLRIIHFDVNVQYPHRIMIVLWEELVLLRHQVNAEEAYHEDRMFVRQWKRVLHTGWRRLNDCLFHVDSLMCNASWLACAALSLAMDDENVTVEEKWWEWLDVKLLDLNETKSKLIQAASIPRIHATM